MNQSYGTNYYRRHNTNPLKWVFAVVFKMKHNIKYFVVDSRINFHELYKRLKWFVKQHQVHKTKWKRIKHFVE